MLFAKSIKFKNKIPKLSSDNIEKWKYYYEYCCIFTVIRWFPLSQVDWYQREKYQARDDGRSSNAIGHHVSVEPVTSFTVYPDS